MRHDRSGGTSRRLCEKRGWIVRAACVPAPVSPPSESIRLSTHRLVLRGKRDNNFRCPLGSSKRRRVSRKKEFPIWGLKTHPAGPPLPQRPDMPFRPPSSIASDYAKSNSRHALPCTTWACSGPLARGAARIAQAIWAASAARGLAKPLVRDGTPIAKLSGHPRDIIASLRSFRSPIDFQLGQAAVAGIRPVDGKPNPANVPERESNYRAGFAVILQAADLDGGAAIAEGQRAGAHAAGRGSGCVQNDLMDSNGLLQSSCAQPPADCHCLPTRLRRPLRSRR